MVVGADTVEVAPSSCPAIGAPLVALPKRWDHAKWGHAPGRDRQLKGQKWLYGQRACAGGRAAATSQGAIKTHPRNDTV